MTFEERRDIVISKGIEENHACCYISNWHDTFICDIHNGPCKQREVCRKLAEEELEKL